MALVQLVRNVLSFYTCHPSTGPVLYIVYSRAGLVQLTSAESFLREVIDATKKARTETEFARLFLNSFEKAIENLEGLEIRMEEHLIKGRTDARVGYVLFEFEMPGKLNKSAERDKSFGELTRHLLE